MALHLGEDGIRRRATGEEDRARADVEREVAGVPQAVGEEELGDAEAAIIGFDAEDVLAVGLAADPHVVLQVDDPLRLAGGAARVEEKGEAVAVGRGVGGERRRRREARARVVGGPELGVEVGKLPRVQDRRVGDDDPRAAIGDDGAVVVRLQERGEGDRDRPRSDGPPERDGVERAVREHQRDPLVPPHAGPLERRRECTDGGVELGIRHRPFVADDGHARPPPFADVAPHEPVG